MSQCAALMYHTPAVEAANPHDRTVSGPEEDVSLVRRVKAGDDEAFEVLVRRYRNDVFALAYHFLRDREEAWDISQDVFVRAYRGIGRFRGEASFKTWLLRITANRCKDFFKKRRLKTVALEDAVGSHDVESPASDLNRAVQAGELGRAIEQALETLPSKHRTAFVLREYDGRSYEEMAKIMGCSLGTVMSRLHHARKKMQNALIAMGVVEVQ